MPLDARRIRARLVCGRQMVCIGSGVIGFEVASSTKAYGCVVDSVEASPSIMDQRVAPKIAGWMARLHEASGVVLHLGIPVTAVEQGRVTFGTGQEIAADCVIAGIGMERNLELAAAAGLAVGNGILVDEWGRTSDENVYAAGGVAVFWVPRLGRHVRLESWKHAQGFRQHSRCSLDDGR